MTEKNPTISLQKTWKPVLILALVFFGLSLIVTLTTTPLYRATATFLIFPNANLTSSRDIVTSLDTLDNKTVSTTYSKIMSSERVFSDTLQQLDLSSEIINSYHIRTIVEANTNIMTLTLEGPDPSMAALLANNIGQNGINYIKTIYQVFDISFLDHATAPLKPYLPVPALYALIGTTLGALIGLIVVLLSRALTIPLAAIRERSITDPVSLAYTRKYLERQLTRELGRTKTEPVAFGLMEISGLEELADALPERYFSRMMQRITTTLHKQLRGNDIVGRWEKISYGILLPSTPEGPAIRTFERIQEEFAKPMKVDDTGQTVQLSPLIGISTRKEGETVVEMIERTRKALAQATQEEKGLAVITGEKS
ncbi:MAG: diguanylate cyclase [Chloroflexi bacterium]|nr:diguanylate cyclase [Chloroflexota bacterium]